MEQIVWEEAASKRRCESDVRVSVKNGHTEFAFHNGAHRKVTNRDRMNVGFTSQRVYFADGEGFKIREYKKTITVRVVTRGERAQFCGDHKMKYDAERKLWYIGG